MKHLRKKLTWTFIIIIILIGFKLKKRVLFHGVPTLDRFISGSQLNLWTFNLPNNALCAYLCSFLLGVLEKSLKCKHHLVCMKRLVHRFCWCRFVFFFQVILFLTSRNWRKTEWNDPGNVPVTSMFTLVKEQHGREIVLKPRPSGWTEGVFRKHRLQSLALI